MQKIELGLWFDKCMTGEKIKDIVRQIAANNFFVECYELTNKGVGDVIGFKYPQFGDSLAVIVTPGGSLAVYDTEMYLDAKVVTYMPENGNRKDYLKTLNNPDSEIVSCCKTIAESLQRAFGGPSLD